MSCNEKNCLCDSVECPRHGKCCECVNFHRTKGNLPKCLRPIAEAQKLAEAHKK